ncbi:hypothetical protein Tco_1394991 [Tanacetum coccineum]
MTIPSLPISLSSPSAGERLARCTAPHAHSPPLPLTSGCLTQIHTLRIASTQALIDAITAALPPPPLPPLPPSIYITPPIDRRDDILESEQPPCKSTVDAGERRQRIKDVGYRIRDTWVDPTKETVWMVEEEAYASREAWAHSIGLSQATHQELQTHRDHMQQAELAALRETNRRRQDQMVETLRVIRDMRREMSDMQAELLALREQQRRARQPGPEARIPDHQDASGDADSHI